jgi:ribosomal protein S18 acetylase RimI-like enzyme
MCRFLETRRRANMCDLERGENIFFLSRKGWPDKLVKKSPKMYPNLFFVEINGTLGKSSPKICATSVIFDKLPKIIHHPIVENSPILVTLLP